MAVRPSVYGRVFLERGADGNVKGRAVLELNNGVFVVNGRLVDASDGGVRIEHVFEVRVNKYYYPLISPLPRPYNPYSLVDYALVYIMDPRFNIKHTPSDSTIVISNTKYVISEGLGYSQLFVYRDYTPPSEENVALWAYPFLPSDDCLSQVVQTEYHMLRRGLSRPTLSAIRACCTACSEELKRYEGELLRRASFDIADLCNRGRGEIEPYRVSNVSVRSARGRVELEGYGLIHLCLDCGGQKYSLSGCVKGTVEWRIEEGCRVVAHSSLCPCF